MKRILGVLLGCLIATAAFGQAQVGPGNVLGNTTAARAPAADSSVTLILDRALGSTRGSILRRGAAGWAIVGPGTTGQPWVSNGSGADPAYQLLGIVGGGTNCAAASGTCLDNITGFASTGIINRTGAGTYSFVSPTRAGDVVFWNGSIWTTLAGNNSGTQIFSENASGVPAWTTAGGVTSVTCGTGLSGGTITATGTCAVSLTSLTNSLGADVNMNVIGNYFPGPTVAQGTSGTWWASGTVTVTDTTNAQVYCKLWDGTTIIASGDNTISASFIVVMSFSGFLASPAANIRLDCRDISNTTGKILFNQTGNSKDSTLSVFRIN